MFRKFAFTVVAAAVLGFAALAPTAASAGGGHGHGHRHGHHGWHGGGWHHGHHHHHWRGPRFAFGGPTYYGNSGCYVRRLVPTPWGPRWRTINRCF